MTEAYSISSRLTFTSNAASIVADLIANFERLDRVVAASQSAIGKVAAEIKTLGGSGRGITRTIQAIEKLGQVRLGGNVVGEIERVTGAATKLAEVQKTIAATARETAAAWRSVRVPSGPAGNGNGGSGGGNGGRGNGGAGGSGPGGRGPWPQAWRDAHADARWEDADFNARRTAEHQLAERENQRRDRNARLRQQQDDRAYDDERRLAEYEHADRTARERAAERAGRERARDDDRSYRADRQMAEYENRERDRRRADRSLAFMNLGIGAQAAGEHAVHTGIRAIDLGFERDHLQTVAGADDRTSPEDLHRMLARARESTQIAPGSTVLENYHALLDVKSVTGSVDEAMQMLPAFAKLTTLLRVMDKRKGGDGAFAAAKAEEIMGGLISEHEDANGHTVREIDPKLLQERLDKMARVDVATNARVTPQDYLAFAKQARVAGMTLSDEFIYEKLPALMQVMGGPRSGTAMMSMTQVYEGGKLTPKSMGVMMDLGLASDDGIEHHVGGHRNRRGEMIGGHDKVHGEAIFDRDLLRHDPLEWVKKAQERMEAKGIHGTEAQINALMNMAQRSTIAGALADLLKDAPAIEKEQQNIRHTRANASDYFAENDPTAKVMQLNAAWTNFLTAMGGAATQDAVSGLEKVTGALRYLEEAASNHPLGARIITDAALGLGAVGIALGALSTGIFIFGPAAKMLRLGSAISFLAGALNPFAAGGAAAGALSTATGGLGALAGALSALAAPLALVLGALWLGNKVDPHKAEEQLNNLSKQRRAPTPLDNMTPQDGFGVDGKALPDKHSSLVRPPAAPVTFLASITLDGKEIASNVSGRLIRSGSGPSGGSTGFDARTIYAGGMNVG